LWWSACPECIIVLCSSIVIVEKNLDFRSDNTTQPTPGMRGAAAKAAVGDMGYGEDPTVSERENIEAFLEGLALLMCPPLQLLIFSLR